MQPTTIAPALFLTMKLNHPNWFDDGWQSGRKIIGAYNAAGNGLVVA